MMYIKIKKAFIYLVFLVFLFISINNTFSQPVSSALLESVQNVEAKLNSEKVEDRISVLQAIVAQKRDYDVIQIILPFNLTENDYTFVLKKILEKDISKSDDKLASEFFWRINALIQKHRIKEVAVPLSHYLQKYDSENAAHFYFQFTILEIIKNLKVTESEDFILPLISSKNKRISSEALRTLVEINSPKAIPFLEARLNDADLNEKFFAIRSLISLNSKKSALKIADLLQDKENNIRYSALEALDKLDAKESVEKIRDFLKIKQFAHSEAYTISLLIRFGATEFLPIATSRVLDADDDVRGQMLEYLALTKATPIIPSLLSALEKKELYLVKEGKDWHVRSGIMGILTRFNCRELIPIAQKILRDENNGLRTEAINILGHFEAKEAVTDLLYVFHKHLPTFNKLVGLNYDYESQDAAIALAKIGDKRAWKDIINFANHPECFYGNQIIGELNRFVDKDLWEKAKQTKLTENGYKPINGISELISKDLNVPVSFELTKKDLKYCDYFQPTTEIKECNPLFSISSESNVLDFTKYIIEENLKKATFVFDNGKIRILPISKAVEWWNERLKNNQKEKTDTLKQTTWKINNLKKIGKYKTEVFGNPKLTKEGIEFDGVDDGIFLDTNPIEGFSAFTIEAIFRPDADGAKEQRWLHIEQYPAAEVRALMETRLVGNEWFLDTFLKSGDNRLPLYAENFKHPVGKWYHVALVYDGKVMSHFVDGKFEMSGEVNFKTVGKGKISFGVRQNKVYWFKGAIKKVRFTNKALSPDKFMKK